MKCKHCGEEIANDSNFCEFCGKKVKKKMPVWAVLLIVLGCVVVLGLGMVTGLLISGNSDSKEKPAPDPVVDTLVEAPVYEETMEAPAPVAEEPTLAAQENGKDIGKKVTEPSTSQQTTTSSTTKAKVVPQGYVDLGLPSGTLWKESNEGDQGNGEIVYYDYDEAVQHFGSSLPTKEQWEELNNSCTWSWNGSGYNVTGPNGQTITLPAGGNRGFSGRVYDMWEAGFYWSTTPKDSEGAWDLEFDSSGVDMDHADRRLGQSVRLVQGK